MYNIQIVREVDLQTIYHVTVARVLNLSPLNYPFVDTINRGTVVPWQIYDGTPTGEYSVESVHI